MAIKFDHWTVDGFWPEEWYREGIVVRSHTHPWRYWIFTKGDFREIKE